MSNYSAQGSITITRLRNGDSLFITLERNDNPLYQGVDTETGNPSPDWTIESNQPIVTPKVTSVYGNIVTLSNHVWKYNGNTLTFDGAISKNWQNDSTNKFQLDKTTGAIKIIANLASKTNIANDTLEYNGTATVSNVAYQIAKSADITIQPVGSSAYYGTIIADTEQLTADVTSTNLKTSLYLGGNPYSSYYVKWYKDDTLWSEKNGQKSINVARGDVDGTQLFIAEFLASQSETTPIFRAGTRITDTLDDYHINFIITSKNTVVSIGNNVTIQAKIFNIRTKKEETPIDAKWSMQVRDENWNVLSSSNTNTITVTTAETDKNGKESDVDVTAEVTWK